MECRIDKLDFEWMKTHIRIYAAYLWELCTAPVLPFVYQPVAEQIIERLNELKGPGKAVGLGGTLMRAKEFAKAARRLDNETEAWRQRFAEGNGDEDAARLINRTMKRMSRLLVPLQSTAIGTYGHDPYGLTAQTTMIPSLYDIPRLSRMKQGEERWMLETKLVRDRNKVGDMLADVIAIIDDTVAQMK